MGKIKNLKILALLAFFLLPLSIFAQENTKPVEPPFGPPPIGGSPITVEGTVNCFDYYKFGSVDVQLNLGGSNDIYSGTEARFQGVITNNNNYPLVSGSVYVKIFKADETDETQIHLNGHSIVDHFFALKDINLDANAVVPIEFIWKVPLYATPGEYYIATYFIVDNKFNISGLSFTDDIIGNKYDFSISSEIKGSVSFDKNTVKINDNPHYFATFIPSFSKDEEVSINMDVVNSGDTEASLPVNFKFYSWDGLQESNLISQESQNVTLKAGERKTLNYIVTDTTKSVYFVVAEMLNNDAKSILNIRFSRRDVNNTRINFVGPTSFPLKKGVPVDIYACMHGMNDDSLTTKNKLLLELKDINGDVLQNYDYEGPVSGAIMAIKKEFIPKKDFDNFTISAKLYKDDILTDSTDLKYDCSLINEELCNKSNIYLYIFIVLGLLVLVILITHMTRIRKLGLK